MRDTIVTGVFIDGVGDFKLYFTPMDKTTYEDMLNNKQYIAKKIIEQLNKIYNISEEDLNEN